MNKEIRKRLISLITTSLFLVISTYTWNNYRTIKTDKLNSYFNQGYLQLEELDNNNLDNLYPEEDSEGLKHKGYTFKINNSSNKNIYYKIVFVTNENNTLDNKLIRYSYNINGGKYSSAKNIIDDTIAIDNIKGNSSNIYNLKIWIDYNATNDVMNKTFSSRIGVQTI